MSAPLPPQRWRFALVSTFKGVGSKKVSDERLTAILQAIKSGAFIKEVTRVRDIYAREGHSDAYAKAKKRLPSFTVSGTFSYRNNDSLIAHSNLLQVDIDPKENPHLTDPAALATLRAKLMADNIVCFVFTSPSGIGLKAAILIDAQDVKSHEQSFEGAANYFRREHGVEIDAGAKAMSQCCFISHDPELWINPDVAYLKIVRLKSLKLLSLPSAQPSARDSAEPSAEDSGQALRKSLIPYKVGECKVPLPCSSFPLDEEFKSHVAEAIDKGQSLGGSNHNFVIPRIVGYFFSLRKLQRGQGRTLPLAQKEYLSEQVYASLKARGVARQPKIHYTTDIMMTINNPRFNSTNPVPIALLRARSPDSTPDLRSAEALFEDENGRDAQFVLFLRLCYWLHVTVCGGEWGITQKQAAKDILGGEGTKDETNKIGSWQELLEAKGVIQKVSEHVKGKKSRLYLWVWKAPEGNNTQQP